MHFSLQLPEFEIFGLKLTWGVPLGFILTLIAVIFMVIVRIAVMHFKEIPKGFQNFIEFFVEWAEKSALSKIPKEDHKHIVPYLLSIVIFIAFNAVLELVGIEPVISSLAATFAMGLYTFFWINWYAFKIKGFKGRLKSLAQPVPFVAPFKVITDIAIPVSMACRLFGNVLAGTIIMTLIYNVCPLIIPAALSAYFSIVHLVIQGYVFITLTLSFIEENIE